MSEKCRPASVTNTMLVKRCKAIVWLFMFGFNAVGCAQKQEHLVRVSQTEVTHRSAQTAPTSRQVRFSPINCEVSVSGKLPDSLIRRIAEGRGLPPEYYSTGAVPEDFCRPIDSVWKFPASDQTFFSVDESSLRRQEVKPAERAVLLSIERRTPPADRVYIKWMYGGAEKRLIVFSMKPTWEGVMFSSGVPYKALNSGSLIMPDDGEVGARPPKA